jgi:hypothetical protein
LSPRKILAGGRNGAALDGVEDWAGAMMDMVMWISRSRQAGPTSRYVLYIHT